MKCGSYFYFTTNWLSGKILFLTLRAKIPTVSQTVGFLFTGLHFKKEVRNPVDFLCIGEHQSFLQVHPYFMVGVARHVQSTPHDKLAIS